MSFSELCDKLDPVISHMKRGEKLMFAISNLLKTYRRTIDTANSQFEKAIENFKFEVPKEGGMDTMSTVVVSLVEYFEKIIKGQSDFSSNINSELIRPFDSFLTQFQLTLNQNSVKGQYLVKETVKLKEKTQKSKEKYYQSCEQLEKYEKMEKTAIEESKDKFDRSEKMQKTIASQRLQVAKNVDYYTSAYTELELAYNKYDSEMPSIMQTLQNSNESYIHFTKFTLERFLKSQNRLITVVKDSIDEFSIIISNINSNIDIRVFVDTNKSKVPPVREEFAKYDKVAENKAPVKPAEEKVKDEDYELIEPQIAIPGRDPDIELVETVLDHLIPEDMACSSPANLDPAFYSKISELLHTPDGRGTFCDVLETKKNRCLLMYAKAVQLVGLIKSFLTSMMIQKDNDSVVFCKIVFLAHVFYMEDENGKRKYLTHFIENHAIWQEKERWIDAIDNATQNKIQSDLEYSKSIPKKKKGLFTLIKNFGKTAFQKDPEEFREAQLAAFTVMNQFCFHMIHLGLTEEISNDIVLSVCHKYDLDQERITDLLAELQANQKMTTKLVPHKISLQLREKEKNRWKKLLPIGLALKYLYPQECFEILLVNKQWNETLKQEVFKKWLIDWDLPTVKKTQMRTWVWVDVLKAQSRPIEYFALLGKILANVAQIHSLNDIIDIDVFRSYQGNDLMPPQILKNILKTYAFYNEEIGYCQGMNYVVGTIYLQIQDEALSFKVLVSLIDKFQMKNLFISSLPKLKLFFYTLDRIIGLILPELHEKFKEISICAGHFSSPWFITLYSSVLQNRPDILYPIWDMFVLEGWKSVFKVAVVILSRLSRHIVAGKFEDVMFVLTNISGNVEIFDSDFVSRVQKVNISNGLLRDLESEYEHLKLKASSSSKNIYL